MTAHKKTRVMNLMGGTGLAILGLALILNKVGEQSIGVLVAIVVTYGLMVTTAFGTALALSGSDVAKLRIVMLWLNWSLIGLYVVGVVAIVLATFAAPDVLKRILTAFVPGAFFFILPELVNIRALKSTQTSHADEARQLVQSSYQPCLIIYPQTPRENHDEKKRSEKLDPITAGYRKVFPDWTYNWG